MVFTVLLLCLPWCTQLTCHQTWVLSEGATPSDIKHVQWYIIAIHDTHLQHDGSSFTAAPAPRLLGCWVIHITVIYYRPAFLAAGDAPSFKSFERWCVNWVRDPPWEKIKGSCSWKLPFYSTCIWKCSSFQIESNVCQEHWYFSFILSCG